MQAELSEQRYLVWYPLRFLSPSQIIQSRISKYATSISGPPFCNVSQFFAMATFWSYQISRRIWPQRSYYREMPRSVTNPGKVSFSLPPSPFLPLLSSLSLPPSPFLPPNKKKLLQSTTIPQRYRKNQLGSCGSWRAIQNVNSPCKSFEDDSRTCQESPQVRQVIKQNYLKNPVERNVEP